MLTALLISLAPFLPSPQAPTTKLEGKALEAAIEELASVVEQHYVFPEPAHAMAENLRARLWQGAYELPDLDALAARLTSDLRGVQHDLHLSVVRLPPRAVAEPDPAARRRQAEDDARRSNFGFTKVEILDGNVGYLELRGFLPAEVARDSAAAAMAFLANTDALIIDLRANGGGEPSMIQLLCGYFFEQPTLLNTFEWRGRAGREESWSAAEVPGKKRPDLPLFVLTSSDTFSAAEEFAYDLKCLKRATLIGARTGGGANPGDSHVIGGVLSVFVPNGRAVNPITGTNWEGTGVEPDVAVPAGQALERARAAAREALAARRAPGSER